MIDWNDNRSRAHLYSKEVFKAKLRYHHGTHFLYKLYWLRREYFEYLFKLYVRSI